jgi:signal transduction histidine kinase
MEDTKHSGPAGVPVPAPVERDPSAARPAASAPRRARLGVGTGLAIIVVTLLVVAVALYGNFRATNQILEQLLRVEQPTSSAALEMEINVLGTGLGVWKYLATGDAVHRERVAKDERDYHRFRAEYGRLAPIGPESELLKRLDVLHAEYSRLAWALMDTRDEHVSRVRRVADAADAIDRILDERIQPAIQLGTPDGVAKLSASTALEADVSEVTTALGVYVADPIPRHRERIAEAIVEVRDHLAGFQRLNLTPEERAYAADIERLVEPTAAELERAVALYDTLRRDQADFIRARNQIDEVLDEGIQLLAQRDVSATAPRASAAINRLYGVSLTVLALGAVVCIGAAGLLAYRSVQLRTANEDLRRAIARREQSESARARLLAELMSVEEKERVRLARELHDQLGQNLSTLMLGLKRLSRPTSPGSVESPPEQELRPLQELTGRLIEQVHTIAWDLRPAALDDVGIHRALSEYVEEWMHQTGVHLDFESSLEGQRLDGPVELALYRVAQEALSNVAKHAAARNVSLTLQRRNDEIVLVVEDDGRGFAEPDLTASASEGRLGLVGMKERAALVGGTLQVESSSERGTTVVVRIPIA